MVGFVGRFNQDEAGAITIDFVVITGAVVGMVVGIAATFLSPAETIASNIDTALSGQGTLDTTNDGN